MAAFNITTALTSLGLSQVAAARLLSVDPRTLRRWVENPGEIPGPAEQALRAWVRLNQYGLPWSHDGVDLVGFDAEQIARHRVHTIRFVELLENVRERGGPSAPWVVDLRKCKATLEKAEVTLLSVAIMRFFTTDLQPTRPEARSSTRLVHYRGRPRLHRTS
jgi:hypothetical protein